MVERDRSTANNGTLDERVYVVSDANWNVMALYDTTGTAKEHYLYNPYGNVVIFKNGTWGTITTSAYGWRYLNQGERCDLNTGLYDVRNREYSPLLGRWMQTDPAGFADGANLYQYEGSNPTGNVDPSGLSSMAMGLSITPVNWGEAFASASAVAEADGGGVAWVEAGIFAMQMAPYASEQLQYWAEQAAHAQWTAQQSAVPIRTAQYLRQVQAGMEAGGTWDSKAVYQAQWKAAIAKAPPCPLAANGNGGNQPSTQPSRVKGDELDTARREFNRMKPDLWKREARENPSKYTPDQLAAMREGRAPAGADGYSMEIHHRRSLAEGGENSWENSDFLTRTQHRLGDNYKINHPNLP